MEVAVLSFLADRAGDIESSLSIEVESVSSTDSYVREHESGDFLPLEKLKFVASVF